jgi:hypothetical protein
MVLRREHGLLRYRYCYQRTCILWILSVLGYDELVEALRADGQNMYSIQRPELTE